MVKISLPVWDTDIVLRNKLFYLQRKITMYDWGAQLQSEIFNLKSEI